MNIHKRLRLTPHDRKEIWTRYQTGHIKVAQLAVNYRVSRPTIYKVLARARKQEFSPRDSTNKRYRLVEYGLKRLAKIEIALQRKLKAQAKRYNKAFPGELMHFDTKRLPVLEGETLTQRRDYLFVAIDDYSRELFAAIKPDRTQHSSASFLEQVIDECPYELDYTYSDNGKEYRGTEQHEFVKLCKEHGIGQKFTRINRPQTNGKAERVIRTLMEMWHDKERFSSRVHRQTSLNRFINFYNMVKPHKGINNMTPNEMLLNYFYPEKL